jgi:hypothetical protein
MGEGIYTYILEFYIFMHTHIMRVRRSRNIISAFICFKTKERGDEIHKSGSRQAYSQALADGE